MLTELWYKSWSIVYTFVLRPVMKWFMRSITGKCELLRITYDYQKGAPRTKKLEKSLSRSWKPNLKELSELEELNYEESTKKVMDMKQILPEIHVGFEESFIISLKQICGYKQLTTAVEALRTTKYSSDNEEHEKKLCQLWETLVPNAKLPSRIGKHWTEIGFQGEDPMTDFRGMGILGLNQLLFFSVKYPGEAQRLLSRSHNPSTGYSYAIVGINITSLLHRLLIKRKLRTHFYNLKDCEPDIEDYHDLYCYMFYEFDKYWFAAKPKDIMDFGRVRDKFKKMVKKKLKDRTTLLKTDFQMQKES